MQFEEWSCLLRCPETGEPLRWQPAFRAEPEQVAPTEFSADAASDEEQAAAPPLQTDLSGWWVGPTGRYPVVQDIARFVDREDFVSSFGFQWNRFEVSDWQEDQATFLVKTGVPLTTLRGQWVLDAGCGGGRYSRVAAAHGARVIAVDRSLAVHKTQYLCAALPNVKILQADLTRLPLVESKFDLVFSIGVLHHSPDPELAFHQIARRVRPGGRLSVWVYRRNWWWQEQLNSLVRRLAQQLPPLALWNLCRIGAWWGGVPVFNRILNKVLNFSNHPRGEVRLCDTYDWYAPRYQSHHTTEEVVDWFRQAGFVEIRELPPEKSGRFYRAIFRSGLLIGSGVNITGIRQ